MGILEAYLKQKPHPNTNGEMLLREVAYERIKDGLINSGVSPGQSLSENSLSKALGISRTPVREAIQQLAQEGFLELIPGRAVNVATQSYNDVLDVVHIRILLEPELVRLACENISPEARDRLEEAMAGMEAAIEENDRAAWTRHDVVYHEIIGRACPNQMLGDTVVQLKNRVHYMANVDTQSNPHRLASCTQEHREIVDAIFAQDSAAAESATKKHLLALRDSLLSRYRY